MLKKNNVNPVSKNLISLFCAKQSAVEIPTREHSRRGSDILAGYEVRAFRGGYGGGYGARRSNEAGKETGVKLVDRDYGGIFLGSVGGSGYGGKKVAREFHGMKTANGEKKEREVEEENEDALNMQDKFYIDLIG